MPMGDLGVTVRDDVQSCAAVRVMDDLGVVERVMGDVCTVERTMDDLGVAECDGGSMSDEGASSCTLCFDSKEAYLWCVLHWNAVLQLRPTSC
jgi:hypothetical protein